MSDETIWADCAICGATTNPNKYRSLPNGGSCGDAEVRRDDSGNSSSGTRRASSEERKLDLDGTGKPAILPDGGKDYEWLTRNARHCGTGKWEQTRGKTQWDRATTEGRNADVEEEDRLGEFWAKLPGGDFHSLLLVKDGDEYAGACDCEGFVHNEGPCAHLCTLRLKEWEGNVSVPVSHDYVRELIATSPPSEDAETETASEDETEDMDEKPVPTDTRETPAAPPQTDDAFATSLPEVDDKFAIDMGGDTYVRKAGYARLLKQQGWIVDRDFLSYSHVDDDLGEGRAMVEARIIDPSDGTVLAESIGTAGPPEKESMEGADMYIDEMAETSAWTRAAGIATGEGLTALAEVRPGKEDW